MQKTWTKFGSCDDPCPVNTNSFYFFKTGGSLNLVWSAGYNKISHALFSTALVCSWLPSSCVICGVLILVPPIVFFLKKGLLIIWRDGRGAPRSVGPLSFRIEGGRLRLVTFTEELISPNPLVEKSSCCNASKYFSQFCFIPKPQILWLKQNSEDTSDQLCHPTLLYPAK